MAAGDATPSGGTGGTEERGAPAPEPSAEGERDGRTGARELLRAALVNDEDPRFPWWLLLPGVVLALGWGAWQAVNADGGAGGAFLGALAWPGPAILALATLATFFGWQLDID
jgi:hypothetical protein